MAQDPNVISSILTKKCPNCRKGNMYTNKGILPLNKMMDMPNRCPVCGQKMEIELGFYYGTGYVSYGLSIAIAVFNIVWYSVLVGFSWKDNSVWWYLGITVTMLVLLQPFIMRLSRVLYLYMFVKYKSSPFKSPEEIAELNQKELNTSQ